MKLLGNNDVAVLPKNFFSPNHRIQSPKTRKILINFICRDASVYQFVFHVFGFIVVLSAVVSTHDDVFYFP